MNIVCEVDGHDRALVAALYPFVEREHLVDFSIAVCVTDDATLSHTYRVHRLVLAAACPVPQAANQKSASHAFTCRCSSTHRRLLWFLSSTQFHILPLITVL